MVDYDFDIHVPIKASEVETPLVAVDRWRVTNKKLMKRFTFRNTAHRLVFVNGLMRYEEQVQHNALITIDGSVVEMCVWTRDLEDVTELDQEYAAYCDSLFRDISGSPR